MQMEASIPSLYAVLSNIHEVDIVRHEAAEALGSIGTRECFDYLKLFAHDSSKVVRESCLVGLEM